MISSHEMISPQSNILSNSLFDLSTHASTLAHMSTRVVLKPLHQIHFWCTLFSWAFHEIFTHATFLFFIACLFIRAVAITISNRISCFKVVILHVLVVPWLKVSKVFHYFWFHAYFTITTSMRPRWWDLTEAFYHMVYVHRV